jgi:uncharacterized protein
MSQTEDCINAAEAVSLADKVRALQSPLTYEDRPSAIGSVETHFAWVFLAGDHAYKLKKPMRFTQLDLATLTARHFVCREEMRLSRRLAPDVYLAVVPLTLEANGSLRIDGGGATVEWLLKMRRLRPELMLDQAIETGVLPQPRLTALGRILAQFYREQQKIPFDPHAYLQRVAQQIEEDCAALRAPELGVSQPLVNALSAAQLAALGRMEQELAMRAQQQRIIEAHGDLRPEHVCLMEPPCVIDSLEFSFDLRTLDPLEELAYFSIECEQARSRWAADAVLDAYSAASGDFGSAQLLDFYRSRRAATRAKVIAWHLRDPVVSRLAPWASKAEEYLAAAIRYAA